MQNAILQQFNETVDFWIKTLDNYTLELLCREPQPGHWSLGQMYIHILDDTGYFIEQMKTALATTGNSDEQMHKHAKVMFSKNSFPDIRIQGPATNTFIPQPKSKEELLQRLVAIKNAVNQLDFTVPGGKTQHPGLQFFNALEWLQFAEMHMRHHMRQKSRIDEQLF